MGYSLFIGPLVSDALNHQGLTALASLSVTKNFPTGPQNPSCRSRKKIQLPYHYHMVKKAMPAFHSQETLRLPIQNRLRWTRIQTNGAQMPYLRNRLQKNLKTKLIHPQACKHYFTKFFSAYLPEQLVHIYIYIFLWVWGEILYIYNISPQTHSQIQAMHFKVTW